MTPAEAAKLLDLPVNATPEQLEARFLELRAKLEDKIAKAPTPGLKAKYRESLEQITAAFESLTLAADGSALPVLQKQSAVSNQPSASNTPLATPKPSGEGGRGTSPSPPARKKSGSGKEFLVVAFIAVVVLGAGGWWVMKTRTENEGKARVAAENVRAAAEAQAEKDRQAAIAKTEADRKTEEARLAAEAKRTADEEEKVRLAAAAKVEQERVDRLTAEVRVGLAELTLVWEPGTRKLREAERRLSDLKGEQRSPRDPSPGEKTRLAALVQAQEQYVQWLNDFLAEHPGRRLQLRTEQFLSNRQVDQAVTELASLQSALATFRAEIEARERKVEQGLYGEVEVIPKGTVDSWILTDSFGQRFEGSARRTLLRVARGLATLVSRRAGWPDQSREIQVDAEQKGTVSALLLAGGFTLTSKVANAEAFRDGQPLGRLPLTLNDLPPGSLPLEVRAEGYVPRSLAITIEGGQTSTVAVDLELRIPSADEIIQAFTQKAHGVWLHRVGMVAGAGLIKITYGSTEVLSKGRFLGMSQTISSWLTVPNPRDGKVFISAGGTPMEIQFVGDKLRLGGNEPPYLMERTKDSAW